MSKKKKKKINSPQKVKKVFEEQQPGKINTLVFGGVLLAMSSMGLLIFVLTEKVFHID